MEALPIKLLYDPLRGKFYCPNVETFLLPDVYTDIYSQCYLMQCNFTDGNVSTLCYHKRHSFFKGVAVWKVKPATGTIEQRLADRKNKSKLYMPQFASFSFN